MKIAKYNDYSNVAKTVVSGGGGYSSGGGSTSLNRVLWGNNDSGGNISDTMFVGGSIYLNANGFDEDAESDEDPDTIDSNDNDNDDGDEYEVRDGDEGGNIYASGTVECSELRALKESYSNEVYLNYPSNNGDKTNILDLFKHIMPIGTILPYAGSESKDNLKKMGWAVCDGTTPGVPDLRNKFLYGADIMGGTGGASSVTLSVNNLPSHSHTATTTVDLTKSGESDPNVPNNLKDQIIVTQRETYYQVADLGGSKHYFSETGYEEPTDKGVIELTVGDIVSMANSGSDGTYTASATTSIGNTGSGNSFSIIPPYYTVVYIMRIS